MPSFAADHYGQVSFAGLPVPGATVTARQGEAQRVASSDPQGVFHLPGLADGTWTIRVEMVGFIALDRDVAIADGGGSSTWELTLRPFEEITRGVPPPAPSGRAEPAPSLTGNATPREPSLAPAPQPDFRRADVNASPTSPPASPAAAFPDDSAAAGGLGAADGFLINGSVNNGAASPFAQLAAFGNNRRRPGSLYTGGMGFQIGSSVLDARPYSFAERRSPKPDYTDVHVSGTFGGPIKLPGVTRNRPNLFVGYQRTSDHNTSTQSGRMPTLLERRGDFSETRDALGNPVQIADPETGLPFSGAAIPAGRISPQAASLLRYYPLPNLADTGRYNFQRPVTALVQQDNVQTRVMQPLSARNQLSGTFSYQRTKTDATTLFGFDDTTLVSGFDGAANWSHRFSPFLTVRLRYQITRVTTRGTPYFANRTNVSGEAGIEGNNQDPTNWGPPALVFSSGVAGLSDALPSFTRDQTHAWGAEAYTNRGRHNIIFGGTVRRHQLDVNAHLDPRGSFGFTGAASGWDLADFILGIPTTSTIAFGNPDKYLRASLVDAYATDDWRVSPTLTVNAGLRWEYEGPMTERDGRLVNLDVAPEFTDVTPVVASDPTGALTGQRYPHSLLRADASGLQPRIGLAWRPVPGSSLVLRAGYGVYRNTAVYPSIALLLAQQPPLSTTLSVENTSENPLTLARGFIAPEGTDANTFAVDPDFQVGFAQNWQVQMQRDLPGSLTVMATYLGTRGSRLMQEFLPNTYPIGAANPCPACPAGFVYLTSTGSSSRHAGQFQVRRRLRNGFTGTIQYTLAEAVDNAAALAAASPAGAAIAQDWRDLDAERGPSAFDQRHLLTAQFEYTTGVGVAGGTLIDGIRGSLFKGWTFTGQLTTGSGLPLTPIYLAAVPGTGVTGTIRPVYTGVATDIIPDGYYANPEAYAAPAAGSWGNVRRNSLRGPAQFTLNAGIGRTFTLGDRTSLDWRVDATNVLNRVTYSGVDTLIGSPQFGLPNRANPMRKLQTSLRWRF
jgi:hypothetical protein